MSNYEIEMIRRWAEKTQTKASAEKINSAILFSRENFEAVLSYDGQPVFTHSLDLAGIAVEMGMGYDAIIVSLLHDAPFKSGLMPDIEKKFGQEIKRKIILLDKLHQASEKQENFDREMFLAISKDIDVMMIELAHMLVNMRRISKLPIERQRRLVKHANEIYLPVALKLGLYHLQSEMGEITFRWEKPEEFKKLSIELRVARRGRERAVQKIKKILEKKIRELGIDAKISGREKSIYSTYKKMQKKNCGLDKIYDLVALRVITNSPKECYEVLGLVHSAWRPIVEEFDDYIAKPKENGYQAIHTTVAGDDGNPIEIQIRTHEMDDYAEFGAASHWRYKGVKSDEKSDQKLRWLKEMLRWHKMENESAPIKKIKFEEKNIFAITPKGEVVELPQGATVLDFAYSIHEDIGNHCDRALVNGKIAQLEYALQNGDQVEISTSPKQKPKSGWLSLVKTEKARKKIMKFLNLKTLTRQLIMPEKKPANSLKLSAEDKRLRFAKCCNPKPGDDVVGYLTTKRKISVHLKDCEEGKKMRQKVNINLSGWKATKAKDVSSTIRVHSLDKSGMLSLLLNEISSMGAVIISANTRGAERGKFTCEFEVKTPSKNAATEIVKRISSMPDIINVESL